MFPLSIKRQLLVEAIAQKEQFAEDLAASLVVKLDSAKILQGENGPSITFPNGFSNALINSKWICGGSVEINYQTEPVKVEYEVFFVYTFVLFCFVTLFYLVLSFQKALEWSILLFVMSAIWTVYGLIASLTALVFKVRIKKSIREVQLIQVSISQEQLDWIHSEDKCPACGYDITKTTTVCPDCQLHLK